jgi:cytochrome c553
MNHRLKTPHSAGPGAWSALAALLVAVFALHSPAAAKPAHLKSLGEHYGQLLPAALNNCATCHTPSTSGKAAASLADFPHNAFGQRVAAVAEQLRAEGKRADIGSRLRAIAAEDSDGDGVPNELELLAGHQPGDRKSRPGPAGLAAGKKRQAQFLAALKAYRWRPFEPVKRPAVPSVSPTQARWVRNPIDAFIAVEHQKRGLKPRPEASKEVLLRRVYLDLTGLSPTPEERRAFLADGSPDAYEKVVDRLLASPHYGERWGRHWMDIWRYSDWTGYGEQVRDSQPHIWRWRDWIVESLNADKGYDRMIVEMLAADEAYPLDASALRATGYLVRNFKLLSREKWMQDTVDHTGQAFLGLTLGCARCHDHMYDPVSQKEYYRLRAFFEPHHVRTDWIPGELDLKKDGLVRAYDSKPEEPTYLFLRGDERQPVKEETLAPGIPEALGGTLKIEPVPLPLQARVPEKQPHVIAALRADASTRVEAARRAVEQGNEPDKTALTEARLAAAQAAQAALEAVLRVEEIEDAGRKDSEAWKAAATEAVRQGRGQAAAETALKRLEATRLVQQLEKAAPPKPAELKKAQEALAAAETALAKAEAELKAPPSTAYKPRVTSSYPAASTGRRLALARWIASAENPLTARVAVNHVWLRHFGQGLVLTEADFGRSGVPPTHPELLDWLAFEFAEGMGSVGSVGGVGSRILTSHTPHTSHTSHTSAKPWSFKRLHRLIVTSSAYRMASTPDRVSLAKDPDNRYLWRMNSRRMDAEIVRDNVLYVAGQLDPKLGGPDIDQHLGLTVKRRTIYFRHAAEKEMVFLSIFDGPNVVECYRRKETVVPQQALALANSEVVLVQSRLLARMLVAKAGSDPEAFVAAAFERVLARTPSRAEAAECTAFLVEQAKRFADPSRAATPTAADPADGGKPSGDPAVRARENLILVLVNHNDFVTIR